VAAEDGAGPRICQGTKSSCLSVGRRISGRTSEPQLPRFHAGRVLG
jgi:hypothetical protein